MKSLKNFFGTIPKGRGASISLMVLVWTLAGIYTFTTAFDSPHSVATTGVGIRSYASQAADAPVTSSTALINSQLTTSIAAGQHVHIRFNVPFALAGTAPGIKLQVTGPSGTTSYNVSAVYYSDADTVVLVSDITTEGAIGFTLATIGNHVAIVDADIIAGTVAGNVTLQFAQNVSNASATTILKGAFAEIVKF